MSHRENSATPYPPSPFDGRMHGTGYPSRPVYLYVTHDGVNEGEFEAVLLDLAARIPTPSYVVMASAIIQKNLRSQRDE